MNFSGWHLSWCVEQAYLFLCFGHSKCSQPTQFSGKNYLLRFTTMIKCIYGLHHVHGHVSCYNSIRGILPMGWGLFLPHITATSSHSCVKSFEPEKATFPAGIYIHSLPVFTLQHKIDFNFTQCQSLKPPRVTGQWHPKSVPTCCRITIAMSYGISIAHFDFSALGRWVGLFRKRGAACSLQYREPNSPTLAV